MECLHDDVSQIIHRMVHRENIKLVHDEIRRRIMHYRFNNRTSIEFYFEDYYVNGGFNISIRYDVVTGEHYSKTAISSFSECLKLPYYKNGDYIYREF